jgi:four helix bundle protein
MEVMIDMPFEKLQVWQKAVKLANLVYRLTRSFPQAESFGLTSQIRRAGVSIPANLAEGSQRKTVKDFSNFILVAKGSLAELRTEMFIARQQDFLTSSEWNDFVIPAKELDKMLRSFYLSVSKKN